MARLLGVEDEDTVETALAGLCAVPDAVGQAAAALLNHKNKTSRDGAARIRAWLAQDPLDRDPTEWRSCLFTDKGDLRKALEGIAEIEREALRLEAAESHLSSCRLLEATEALLALAGPVLDRVEARKRSAGLLGYDDLIATAERVLKDPGSAWVLFKLDGGLDHILLDEAQDTNPAQWGIASALTSEFFAGEGRRDNAHRTIFAVGDIKQAIYGFQGADAAGFGVLGGRVPPPRPGPRRAVREGRPQRLLPLHRAGAGPGRCGLRRWPGPRRGGRRRRHAGASAGPRRPGRAGRALAAAAPGREAQGAGLGGARRAGPGRRRGHRCWPRRWRRASPR